MTIARRILLVAAVVGIAADVLLRVGFAGIGFPLWIALLALATLAIARWHTRAMTPEARGWLAAALLAAAGLAWRAAPELQALDFLATLLALGLAGVTIGQPRAGLHAGRLRDTIWAAARVLRDVFIGALPLAVRELIARDPRVATRGDHWRALRAALIVAVVILVFGSLLRGADPIFASLLRVPDLDIGVALSHVVLAGFFAWIFAGWARGAFVSPDRATQPPEHLPFTLGATEMTAALATLDLLFALFIVAQLGWLFGGEQFLQARTGLTAAQYARQGFFQMVFVVLLAIPLLVASRALLPPAAPAARRHSWLAIPMVVLMLAMIASAALRMRLYVSYYGLSTGRLYTLAIMAWLAFVLLWLAVTTLRAHEGRFIGGALLSALATLLVLNVVVPDRVVARVNVARAPQATPSGGSALDVAYLATLSGDALATVIPATLTTPTVVATVETQPASASPALRDSSNAQRCQAAQRILRRWGPDSRAAARRSEAGAWRLWNAGEQQAFTLASENAAALRAVERETCIASSDSARAATAGGYR